MIPCGFLSVVHRNSNKPVSLGGESTLTESGGFEQVAQVVEEGQFLEFDVWVDGQVVGHGGAH